MQGPILLPRILADPRLVSKTIDALERLAHSSTSNSRSTDVSGGAPPVEAWQKDAIASASHLLQIVTGERDVDSDFDLDSSSDDDGGGDGGGSSDSDADGGDPELNLVARRQVRAFVSEYTLHGSNGVVSTIPICARRAYLLRDMKLMHPLGANSSSGLLWSD